MNLRTAFSFLFSCWIGLSVCDAQLPPDLTPMYARRASMDKRVVAPDGKTAVSLRSLPPEPKTDFPLSVTVDTGGKKLRSKIFFGLNTEVLWSSDSKAFAVSGSSEGANGQYWTEVFLLQPDRLVAVPLAQTIRTAFGHPVKCGWPEYPNVAAVTWIEPSKKILVAAEIIHHSNCDSFGTFKAYEVDLSTKSVTKTYNQLEAKRLFGKELGTELADSRDNCIRHPKRCYVAANHPELTH